LCRLNSRSHFLEQRDDGDRLLSHGAQKRRGSSRGASHPFPDVPPHNHPFHTDTTYAGNLSQVHSPKSNTVHFRAADMRGVACDTGTRRGGACLPPRKPRDRRTNRPPTEFVLLSSQINEGFEDSCRAIIEPLRGSLGAADGSPGSLACARQPGA